MTLDASGRLLVGTTQTYLSTFKSVVEGATSGSANFALGLFKSGTPEILNGDVLGNIYFYGVDNSITAGNNNLGAQISCVATTDWTTDGTTSNAALVFYTHGTASGAPPERARITSGGYFKASNAGTYYGSTGAYHELRQTAADYICRMTATDATASDMLYMQSTADPNDTTYKTIYTVNNATPRFYVQSNGGIYNYSANNSNLSDRREKTNFAPAKNYLDIICAIPVQTFNYIDQNRETDDGLTLGVVAQDVQAVAPELVMESNWGTEEQPKMRLSIYQTDLQYALMKCIQEQQEIINDLRARVAQLEQGA